MPLRNITDAAAVETDAPLLAMIEEAGAIDPERPHLPAERIAETDRLWALWEQIETTAAATLEGVAAKLRCLDHQLQTGQTLPIEFVTSALADLDRLAGRA